MIQDGPKLITVEAGTCRFTINSHLFCMCLKFFTIKKFKRVGGEQVPEKKGKERLKTYGLLSS